MQANSRRPILSSPRFRRSLLQNFTLQLLIRNHFEQLFLVHCTYSFLTITSIIYPHSDIQNHISILAYLLHPFLCVFILRGYSLTQDFYMFQTFCVAYGLIFLFHNVL